MWKQEEFLRLPAALRVRSCYPCPGQHGCLAAAEDSRDGHTWGVRGFVRGRSAVAGGMDEERWRALQRAPAPHRLDARCPEESLGTAGVWERGLLAFKHHELFRRSKETGCSLQTAAAGNALRCGAGTGLDKQRAAPARKRSPAAPGVCPGRSEGKRNKKVTPCDSALDLS